jgi:hypothetical protein
MFPTSLEMSRETLVSLYGQRVALQRDLRALFVAHFNFCHVHSAFGLTPAEAAGLTGHQWTIGEILASAI